MKTSAPSKPAPATPTAAAKGTRRPAKKEKDKIRGNSQTFTIVAEAAPGQNGHTQGNTDDNVSVKSSPSEQDIAARAYSIWLENGCVEGRDEDHWRQAQQELAGHAPAS